MFFADTYSGFSLDNGKILIHTRCNIWKRDKENEDLFKEERPINGYYGVNASLKPFQHTLYISCISARSNDLR